MSKEYEEYKRSFDEKKAQNNNLLNNQTPIKEIENNAKQSNNIKKIVKKSKEKNSLNIKLNNQRGGKREKAGRPKKEPMRQLRIMVPVRMYESLLNLVKDNIL